MTEHSQATDNILVRHTVPLRYKFALALFGAACALFAIEIVLRSFGYADTLYRRDPATGLYTLKPSSSLKKYCIGPNIVETNSMGFHAREYALEKPKGTFRVAILGDSFVEGAQVPRSRTIAQRLEEKLNQLDSSRRYEVLSFGISEHGTYLNLLFLKEYALRYNPDLVIDVFFPQNDVSEDFERAYLPQPQFDAEGHLVIRKPYYPLSGGFFGFVKRNLKRSAAARASYAAYRRLVLQKPHDAPAADAAPGTQQKQIWNENSVYLKSYPPFWEYAWQQEAKLFSALTDTAREHDVTFLLVSTAEGRVVVNEDKSGFAAANLDPDLHDLEKPEKMLQEIANRENLPYLALYYPFRDRYLASKEPFVVACDGHWNETGHAWAAEEIAKYLFAHPALLEK